MFNKLYKYCTTLIVVYINGNLGAPNLLYYLTAPSGRAILPYKWVWIRDVFVPRFLTGSTDTFLWPGLQIANEWRSPLTKFWSRNGALYAPFKMRFVALRYLSPHIRRLQRPSHMRGLRLCCSKNNMPATTQLCLRWMFKVNHIELAYEEWNNYPTWTYYKSTIQDDQEKIKLHGYMLNHYNHH